MSYGYYNGEYAPLEELKIPALDRSVYFGDGVYDVTTLVNGCFFAYERHYNRFVESCKMIDIAPRWSKDELFGIFTKLVEKEAPEGDALIYWQASRGTAMRSHSYGELTPNLFAYIKPLKRSEPFMPLSLITYEDIRFEMCNVKTLNLLVNVLASKKAADSGCYEAVLHRGQTVTEGSHTSISILNNGAFVTPPLSKHILPSVTRAVLIELCGKIGVKCEIREFTLDELRGADEIIVASATTLLRRAEKLDGAPVGGKAADLYDFIANEYLNIYTKGISL